MTQQPPKSKTCKRSGCLHRIKYVQKNKEKDSGNMEGAPAKGTSERELLTSLATPQASL